MAADGDGGRRALMARLGGRCGRRLTDGGGRTSRALCTSITAVLLISGLVVNSPALLPLNAQAAGSGSRITEFRVPTTSAGPDGISGSTSLGSNVWFTEYSVNKIAKITLSGVVTEYAVNTGPESITVGPDGNLWFTEINANRIGEFNPRTNSFTDYLVPTANAGPEKITVGPDNNLWFSEDQSAKIAKITTAGAITEYPVPDPDPGGIAPGPDGNVWYADYYSSVVGKVNPSTGAVATYSLPGTGTSVLVTGSDGNVYVTQRTSSQIARIVPATGAVTEYTIPTANSNPLGIASGPDKNIWFTEGNGNNIGVLNIATGAFTEFAIPTASATPSIITAGPDNNMWFAEYTGDQIGRLDPGPLSPVTSADTNGGGSPSERYGCACHKIVSKPVDTATGAFFHTFTDMAIPGRGLALDFTRTYNSTRATTSGPLGFGWTDSYAMSLAVDPVSGNATVNEEGGSSITFTLSGTTYAAPSRVMATLVKNSDGTFTMKRTVARTTYTFSATGQLTAETDRNGYSTTFTYNSSGQLASITDPAGRALTLAYTGSTLTTLTDVAGGRKVTYGYNDGLGNLTDVTDVGGGTWHFTYDTNHLLLTMTDPRNGTLTNVYDTSSRVTSQTDALQRKTTFAYSGDPNSAAGSTTVVTDPKGNQVADQYSLGERTATTQGYGTAQAATWTYAYDPVTLALTSTTDPNGHTTAQTDDSAGNVLSTVDALGRATSMTYDSQNDLLTATDPLGVTTTRTYDANGNLLSVSTPLVGSSPAQSEVTGYTYGDSTHPGDFTAMTDPDSKTWSYTYDTNGDLTSTTDPLGNKASVTYNSIGWPTSRVSPRGNVTGCNCASQYTTTLSYADPTTGVVDQYGDVRVITDPLGHQTIRSYDADRNLASRKDADGNLTQYTYDLDNEQTVVTRADQTTLKTDYNADGTVLDQVDGLGRTTSYGYDSLGRRTSVTDPLNRTTSATHDAAGNVKTVVDPQSPPQTTTSTYDAANQLTAISYSDGKTPNVSSIGYDADGQRTAMTDGTGTSSWVWDSLHRLASSTQGAGQSVSYGYDLKGQVTSIVYPGSHTVARAYDDAGRLHTVSDWLQHTTTFSYDPDGNLTGQAYPNGTTATMTVDAAQRLMNIADAPTANPSSAFASFAYGRDANNQVTSVTSTGVPSDTNSYTYTPLNQLNQVNTAHYGYDAADNPTGLVDGTVQSFDNANEVTSAVRTISVVGTASAEGSSGNSLSITLPSGVQPNDQILVATTQAANDSVTTPTGYTLVGSAQTGSGGSNAATILYRRTAAAGDTSVSFTYGKSAPKAAVVAVYRGVDTANPVDAQSSGTTSGGTQVTVPSVTTTTATDRLLMVEGSTGSSVAASWTQPSGMSDEVHRSDMATAATALGDQALTASGATGTRTATYGSSAQLVGLLVALTPASTAYTYDPRGDRTTATPSSGSAVSLGYDQANRLTSYGTTATYAYNADGLRMSKTVSGTTTPFTWDVAAGLPLLLYDGSISYLYGPGGVPLEQVTPSGAAQYYHQDQLGSTRLLTDQTGAAIATFTYDAYGKLTASTGTATTPLLYAGEYRDSESTLYYLRARYYDPTTAQFLTVDPLASLTRARYGYVHDNPLNATDPTGLSGGLCNDELNPGSCLGDVGSFFEGAAAAAGAVAGAIAGWFAGSSDSTAAPTTTFEPTYDFIHPCPNQARPADVDPNLRPKKALEDALQLQRYIDSLGRSITPEDPGPVGPSFKCGRYCKILLAATGAGAGYEIFHGLTNTESPIDRPGEAQ